MDMVRVLLHLLLRFCRCDAALRVQAGVDGGEGPRLLVADGAVVNHIQPLVVSVPSRDDVNGKIPSNNVVIT